jgi:hypothetical protein
MTNSVAFCKDTSYKCDANIDHGVLVVGYGIESGLFSEKYWYTSGGYSGYIKLASGEEYNRVIAEYYKQQVILIYRLFGGYKK